ncbi:MAG: hypothetical protein A3K19_14445 [Lentisphaerae bacterium RIFOXYB12_FULL_65_16]|nr:MAG: hypothetical protein A3K18_18490 [Lentisphaerae bacterium RIFOXYA12_64_32]OGV87423.1 MAG: hypothetical protein A3K19_14445 [Lentisphaerae bacterium RIFOXYB12_FULL_65_16]
MGLALILLGAAGCGKGGDRQTTDTAPPAAKPEAAASGGGASCSPGGASCDFAGGPEDAKVKVEAFYPGRHEDTLAAVKDLLTEFPGQVRVEIVDWRTEQGLARRDATGLVCAGVVINGKNTFDLEVDGKPVKVLFVRGIDGEWTKTDLVAAVRKTLQQPEDAKPAK